jgi:hypothetical protein
MMDFEADAAALTATDEGMSRLSALVQRQLDLEDEIGKQENVLQDLNVDLTRVRTDLIPSLMKELGFKKVTAENGAEVEIKPIVNATVPQDSARKEQALEWLRSVGLGDLIKNQVSAVFGRGEDDLANRVSAAISQMGVDVERKISVSPQSLSAAVRQRRSEGKEVNTKVLSVFEGEVAKIKRPKVKGRKQL